MKIIIPASGTGERFKAAGYVDTKPLIPVTKDKRILDYVIDCFSSDDEYFFITSPETYNEVQEFLETKDINYKHILYSGPKLGPVGAILGIQQELLTYISPDDEVIVSYCDYGMKWDYSDFKEFIKETNADAAIPCYRGYHPHLEDENNVYACTKTLSQYDTRVYKVFEKYKSKDRYNENWSAGLYYFKDIELMLHSFNEMILNKDTLNDEYYVSLAYNYIVDTHNVQSYNKISKFYQFGTPKDFEYVKEKLNNLDIKNDKAQITNTVILSAGKGERFLKLNYQQPKPFLPLNNKALVQNIADTFSEVSTYIRFVGSDAHTLFWNNLDVKHYGDIKLIESNKIGAAYSYRRACSDLTGETLVVPCDLLAKHITEEFLELKETSDIIIFTAKPNNFNIDNSNSFAWVQGENNEVHNIAIKERKPKMAEEETVLIGSFWVKSNSVLLSNIEEIFKKGFTVNDEYYLDNAFKNMLDNALKVKYLVLDNYYSLGTPSEYEENKYWLEIKGEK
jgi:NDP-sugar pyrophosphorylase family protein